MMHLAHALVKFCPKDKAEAEVSFCLEKILAKDRKRYPICGPLERTFRNIVGKKEAISKEWKGFVAGKSTECPDYVKDTDAIPKAFGTTSYEHTEGMTHFDDSVENDWAEEWKKQIGK